MDAEHRSPAAGEIGLSLGARLKGLLSCVRCHYDLRGLSVRGVCPECGTPIRATLLAVVDPHARELRPLYRPRLTSAGIVLWAVGALIAVGVIWWVRTVMLLAGNASAPDPAWIRQTGLIALGAMVLSGLGAAALVRPHDRVPARWQWAALLGVFLYIPLIAVHWHLLVHLDSRIPSPYPPGRIGSLLLERTLVRLLASALLAAIIVLLRPTARMLAARSLVMRLGRADRQTMFALVSTIGLWSLGDLLILLAQFRPGSAESVLLTFGMMFIAAGSVLFTLGLVWLLVDVVRLCPILIEPAPAVSDVMEFDDGEGSA